MEQTKLEQYGVSTVGNCLAEFQKRTTATTIPLVLNPHMRPPCSVHMTVPTGPYCIMHEWGRDISYHGDADDCLLAEPGFQCAASFKRVAYCVNANAITYQAPVKSCPTSDNVMVDCDLTLVFGIGPASRDVKNFVYKIGVRRFDEMLTAAVQESIRHLIRTCQHTEIYELRGSGSDKVSKTLVELNKKFSPFGVQFMTAAITEVRFSQTLQDCLQNTTEYESKRKEESKRQKNEMDKIKFRQNREITELLRQHAQIIQDLQAKRTRVEINRKEDRTRAEGNKSVAVTRAKQVAKVAETQAKSEKKVAQNQGETLKRTKVSEAMATDKSTRIRVEAECAAHIIQAKKALAATQNIVKALKAEADMEGKAAPMMKLKREYDLRMAKLEVLANIAANNRIVLCGEDGDNLLKEMVTDDILGDITVANNPRK